MPRPARPSRRPLLSLALLPVFTVVVAPAAVGQEDGPGLSAHYGFGELDVLKVEDRSEYLRTADLNGDGLTDLLLSDDSNSRLDLFLQRETPDPEAAAGDSADPNALPDSARYEQVKLSVDRAIYGLIAEDFTADGRTDILYVGAPDRLVLVTAPEGEEDGTSDWAATAGLRRTVRRLPDLELATGMLAAGDLTGDGRPDVAVIGERVTYILPSLPDGGLGPAEEVRNTSDDLSLAQIGDLDGDGLADLCYTARVGDDRVLAARLQERPDRRPEGEGEDAAPVPNRLGPELRFDLTDPRSVTLGDAFPDEPGVEVLAVTGQTGRLTVRTVRRPTLGAEDDAADAAGGLSAGRKLTQYGFGGRGERDFAVGDLDGDGRADVVVSDADGARVILFRQTAAGGLDLGSAYPSLAGVTQVRIGDADGDGAGELFVLSETEEVLGRSVWEDGRLTFPTPVVGVENAVAFTLVDVPGADRDAAFVVSETGRREYTLGLVGAPDRAVELDLSADPDRLEAADVDGNGAPDLVLFPGRGKDLMAFGIGGDGTPVPLKNEGLGPGEITPGAFFAGALPPEASGEGEGGGAAPAADVPTILAARGNLARDLTARAGRPAPADAGGDGDEPGTPTLRWAVRDQFNAGEAAARIAGAVTLDVDGEPGAEVVLIDTGVDKLRVLKRDGSRFVPAGEVETGKLNYQDAAVADLDGDARDDLLLFGEGRFSVLYAGRTDPTLVELANYETDLDRTFLADSLVGDLNGDGSPDVAALEVRSHFVEVLRPTGSGEDAAIQRALYWKLFEEKNFDGEGGGGLEPREGAIADVTGDGRNDLILLVHDRVLIYPQDDGRGSDDANAGAAGAE